MIKLIKAAFLTISAIILLFVMGFTVLWIYDSVSDRVSYYIDGGWFADRDLRRSCYRHISESERKAEQVINQRARQFGQYLKDRKSGSRAFSNDVLSLSGKWHALKPYLPFTDSEGHKKYIQRKLDEHIISENQLAHVLRRSIEDMVRDIEAIENDLAVSIRTEILGRSLKPDEIPIAKRKFERSLQTMMYASRHDALRGLNRFVISEVSTVIGTAVLARLAVSLGILKAGAVSGKATFGIGLILGFIIDAVYSAVTDPKGEIQRELNKAIDIMAKNGEQALRVEMENIMDARAKVWKNATRDIIRNR